MVLYAFEMIKAYLFCTNVVVHTHHDAIQYFMEKKDANPTLTL